MKYAPRITELNALRNEIANLSVWSGKVHSDQQLVDLVHVLAILDTHTPAQPAPVPAVPDDVAGLAKRLRAAIITSAHVRMTWPCVGEAADTIEAQAAELAQAKAESARFRLLLGEIATLGRCDFAKVRAAINLTGD